MTNKELNILFLEDNPLDVDLAKIALRQAGLSCKFTVSETRKDFIENLNESIDVILADYTLPQYNAIDALKDIKEHGLDVPVIIVTGTVSEEVAVECIKQGAADYLLKDRLARLGAAINQALEEKKLQKAKVLAEEELRKSEERYRFLVEFSPDPVILYFGDILNYANQACLDTLGASSLEEVVGKTAYDFVHPEDYDLLRDRDHRTQTEGETLPADIVRTLTLDGRTIYVEVKTSRIDIQNEKGEQAYLTVFRDLSDRVHREKELQAIGTISEALRMATDPAEVVPVLLDEVTRLLEADGALLGICDSNTKDLIFTAGHGIYVDIEEGYFIKSDSVPEYVYQTRDIYLLSADGIEVGKTGLDKTPLEAAKSIVVIPLIAQEKSIGVMGIGKSIDISEQDIRLLRAIGDIAGTGLHRAFLQEEMEANFVETVVALANTLEVRHTQTADHSQKMALFAVETFRLLADSEEDLQIIRWGALLHDIGKIGIPDDILQKDGPLTDEEWETIKKHPEIGAEIVAPIRKLADVAPIVRAHQEKFDGTGYPFGLKGEEIPLGARVLAVVDAYSAMTEDRVYRKAIGKEAAIKELKDCAGKDFDPQVVEAFIEIIDEFGGK